MNRKGRMRRIPPAKGALFVVATPIGNLSDITLRALDTLRSVDLIAAEDTRHTRKLLSRYDIHKPLVSYHEHNAMERGPELLDKIASGRKVAVVSDAGTPGISDPGSMLVEGAPRARVGRYRHPRPHGPGDRSDGFGTADPSFCLSRVPARAGVPLVADFFPHMHPSP